MPRLYKRRGTPRLYKKGIDEIELGFDRLGFHSNLLVSIGLAAIYPVRREAIL
jgi:hypothetical protein